MWLRSGKEWGTNKCGCNRNQENSDGQDVAEDSDYGEDEREPPTDDILVFDKIVICR